MSKALVILFLLLLGTKMAMAKDLVIISDLDETLKMANVENKVKAGMKLVEGVKPYEALKLIFKEIKANNPDATFYYLSNSYPFLYSGKRWIKRHGLPAGTVMQRTLKDGGEDFKARKLKSIGEAHPHGSFLMFGDNVERDPTFYRNFIKDSKLTDAKVFIRDARLIFPQETDLKFFQTELQIVDDLKISSETEAAIEALPFNKLIPKFLFKNLHTRLVKACDAGARKCEELADRRVQEVKDILSLNSQDEDLAAASN